MNQPTFRMTAQTMFDMEDLLITELEALGATDIEKHNRAVSFIGTKETMYRANLHLRTALRILIPIAQFQIRDENELYNQIGSIDWEQYMGPDQTLAISVSLHSRLFTHSQFLAQKSKDAIADQFRNKYDRRPSVDLQLPDLRINLHINDDNCMVSLDSSGESLHKRGYRDQTNLAPINEVLAAGLILKTGWSGLSTFVDPMCGSGTILIEAALIARHIPPGFYRKSFGFQRWKDYDDELWKNIYNEAKESILEKAPFPIIGGELSKNVARKGIANLHEAGVDESVDITACDFSELRPPEGEAGVMVINPPYGERMNKEDIEELYASMGDNMKKNWTGYDVWMITSNMEAAKKVGLKASKKIKMFNGSLECRFYKYEMYMGSRRKPVETTTE